MPAAQVSAQGLVGRRGYPPSLVPLTLPRYGGVHALLSLGSQVMRRASTGSFVRSLDQIDFLIQK